MQFVPISDPSNATVLLGHTDWRSAVSALITQWASIGRPYSSGEVAACVHNESRAEYARCSVIVRNRLTLQE